MKNVLLNTEFVSTAKNVERINSNKYAAVLGEKVVIYERYLSGFECHFNILIDGVNWYYNNSVDDDFIEAYRLLEELYMIQQAYKQDNQTKALKTWHKGIEDIYHE